MIAIVNKLEPAGNTNASIAWAIRHLREQLAQRDIKSFESKDSISSLPADLCIRLIGSDEEALKSEPEAFQITNREADGRRILDIAAHGMKGFLYALLELADRTLLAEEPLQELMKIENVRETPQTKVRSINRLFVSEVEDKPWFYNRTFWQAYFTELATHRFNKFHLALGMGYDYGHDPGVRDNYFCFAYPFLVDIPGYSIRVKGLPDGEAAQNLNMLRFISEEAKLRGIHFQLGLWTHAYDPSDSPVDDSAGPDYGIEGLDTSNHAAYCRDAVRTVLQACPAIAGITFRVHYESGIPEPAHEFWREVFAGAASAGRPVELDLHPKGADEALIQTAIDTGLNVVISPKYWAEHMGLPYHQAAIREKEMPTEQTDRPELMALTATSRRFTRYGYADYLKENRKYGILIRIWPGTQRVLLWGDPLMAAAYARSGSFSGCLGMELCEPLAFKGRKGSGTEGGRDPYIDPDLKLNGEEWRKYLYWYRVWGRKLYNPDGNQAAFKRFLHHEFGEAGEACGIALANASRILPLVTTSHLPSAANNIYWPEMYANMAIIRKSASFYDFDTLPPQTFNSVSPLDPALFYSIDEYAADLASGKCSGKVSPPETAAKLEQWSDSALASLDEAVLKIKNPQDPAFRRWIIDVKILAWLGRFFAGKLQAGLKYAMYEQIGDNGLLAEALAAYRQAKEAWEQTIRAGDAYARDITFGYVPYMRGHWSDRLPAIDADLAEMDRIYHEAVTQDQDQSIEHEPAVHSELQQAGPEWAHESPKIFHPGEPVVLELTISEAAQVSGVTLHVRRANQSDAYTRIEMKGTGSRYTGEIPGTLTDSVYPVVYFFETKNREGKSWLLPGFNHDYANQPYYLLRQSL